MLQEEQLSVADAREPGAEPAGGAALVLGLDGVLVALPVFAIGRIGEQVVEAFVGEAVARERAAELDIVGIGAVGTLHVEVGLADGERLGVDLLAEQMHLGMRVQLEDALFSRGEYATTAAAGVIHSADDVLSGEGALVLSEEQADHEADHLTRGEVLAGVLVQRLVELADQLLEDIAHLDVGDLVRVQVYGAKALHHLEEQACLVELGDGVVEVELFEDFAHVGAEAGDVVVQVGGEVGRVGEQTVEGVERRVVEGEAGGAAQLRIEILELALELSVDLKDMLLGGLEHAIKAAQDREGQDDVLVLAALEGVADEVCDAPEEVGDLAEAVHSERHPVQLAHSGRSRRLREQCRCSVSDGRRGKRRLCPLAIQQLREHCRAQSAHEASR